MGLLNTLYTAQLIQYSMCILCALGQKSRTKQLYFTHFHYIIKKATKRVQSSLKYVIDSAVLLNLRVYNKIKIRNIRLLRHPTNRR